MTTTMKPSDWILTRDVRSVLRKLRDAVFLIAAVFVFNFFLFRIVDRDPLAVSP